MRILVVGNSNAGGGVSRYIEGLVQEFDQSEEDITFIDLKEIISKYPTPLAYHGIRNEFKKIRLLKELTFDFWKQIENSGYDLVHFLNFNLSILPCLYYRKRNNMKVIKTSHGMWAKEELFQGFIPNKVYKPILEIMQKRIHRELDGVIYVSDAQEKEFKNKFNLEKQHTYVTYLASSITTYNHDIKKLIDEKENKIIYVGRIEPRKDLDKFMKLAAKMLDYRFYLIGRVENEEYLKRITLVKTDNVYLDLNVQDYELIKHYLSAKFFVSFSKWENCPVSYLESVSQGTPVIAISQNIVPLENKCAFKIKSVDEACKIINSLEKDYSKYVESCISVSNTLSWNRVMLKTLNIYEEILSNN